MPWSNGHMSWLIDTGERIKTVDGKEIEVFDLNNQHDEVVLSKWARHFRNHYCLDAEIDELRQGTGLSRKAFLNQIKLPDSKVAPGPSLRSGDFGEILVADYLEYVLGFWVSRTRYLYRETKDQPSPGSDVMGFQILKDGDLSKNDTLAIFEVKASLTGTKPEQKMQIAIDHSSKDASRKAESLNAIKQRLRHTGDEYGIKKIERFQNEVDTPYTEIYGAAAIMESIIFNVDLEKNSDASTHPHAAELKLVLIKGDQLMSLVRELYGRVADEA